MSDQTTVAEPIVPSTEVVTPTEVAIPEAQPLDITVEGVGSGRGDDAPPEVVDETPPADDAPIDVEPIAKQQNAAPKPSDAPAPEPAKKTPGRLQRRIDALIADKASAERRVESLSNELNAIKHAFSGEKQPQVADFSDYADFVDARARYVAKREMINAREQGIQESLQQAGNNYIELQKTKVQEARDTYKDWDQVAPTLGQILGPDTAAYHEMFESDHFAEIAYHLAKNQSEAYRLRGLSPRDQQREILRLEAKVAINPNSLPSKRVSQAPVPSKPAQGKSTADTVKDLNKMSMDEYAAHRRSQQRR